MICPDCKGSKVYIPFFGPKEDCRMCGGIGEVADVSGTTVTAANEEDSVIRFSVTSDGTTGPQWIERLEKKGFRVSDYAKSVLLSSDFRPSSGITTEIAVLKGTLFSDSERITKNIRAEAGRRGLTAPNTEVVCLIREKFTNKDLEQMGLWCIVTMHEPIKNSVGVPFLLGASRAGDGRWLYAYYGRSVHRWFRVGGFAFAVAQVGA